MVTQDRTRGAHTPCILPVFPLLLLETMRDVDRPDEVLEGEDLAASLPRRLGLSDVIYLQIHKFREETKRKALQTPATVEDLIRLVIRRPDAGAIFEQAGRRVARWVWARRSSASRRTIALMPWGVRQAWAKKGTRRLFSALAGDAKLQVLDRPVGARVTDALTARVDPSGVACAFYGGVLAELMSHFTGRRHVAEHLHCQARGAEACEWRAVVME